MYRSFAMIGMAAALMSLVPGSTSAQQHTFRVGFQTGAPDTPVYVTGTKLKQAVEHASGGRIKLDLFPGGTLGDQIALVSGVRTGTIDIGIMVAWSVATV